MIGNLVLAFTLVLARVGTFVTVFPLFGSQNVPRLVKVGLTFALTVVWFTSLYGGIAEVEWAARPAQVTWLSLGIALGREALLGALLGYAFGLFLAPVRIAGEYLTEEMGLSFGAQVNPNQGGTSASLSQIFEALATFLFLGLDGHHIFLAVFYGLFTRYPVGGPMHPWNAEQLVTALAYTEEWGLLLAAPVGICLFISTVVLVLMTRAAPQLNLYSVGFPLRLGVGLIGLLLFFPHLANRMVQIFGRVSDLVLRLV